MLNPMRFLSDLKAKEVMSTNVIVIKEDDPISFVFNMFERCHISGAPVVNAQGEYSGVITKTDLTDPKFLGHLSSGKALEQILTKDLMKTNSIIAVEEETSLADVVCVMAEQKIHRVFVSAPDENVVGIISTFDVVKLMAKAIEAENEIPILPQPGERPVKGMLEGRYTELYGVKAGFN